MSLTEKYVHRCDSSLLSQDCRQSCYAIPKGFSPEEINRKLAEAAVTDHETAAEAKAKEIVQFLMKCLQN